MTRSGASGRPSKQAVVGQVSTRLAYTVDELSLKSIRVEAEEQHVHTRPPVRCGVRTHVPFDARLDLASDDRGGKPGHGFGRRSRPAGCLRSDDHPRRTHAKGLREGVNNPDAVALHHRFTLTHAVQVSV